MEENPQTFQRANNEEWWTRYFARFCLQRSASLFVLRDKSDILLNKLWKKASFSCVHHCALSLRHCFNNSHETPLFFHMTLMHRGGERSSSLFTIVLTTYNWGCIFGLAQQSHHSWIPSKRLIRGWTTRNTTHCPRMTRVQRHVPNNTIYTFAGVEEHCEIGLFAVALRNSLCSVASKWISMLMIGYS